MSKRNTTRVLPSALLLTALCSLAAPRVRATDLSIDLDGDASNGRESTISLNVVSTGPTKVKDKITNRAVGAAFHFDWPLAGPGGLSSELGTSIRPGSLTGVGVIWTWQTTQRFAQVTDLTSFSQTFPPRGTLRPSFLTPGLVSASGGTVTQGSLTASLSSFFSPPLELVRISSGVEQLGSGLFRYTTRVENLTPDPLVLEWAPGPLGCTCGNGALDDEEQCDGSDLGRLTCASFGARGSGTLQCNPRTCRADLSGCVNVCGNGIRETQEEEACDGAELGGKTCADFGLAGTLACFRCTFDLSGCHTLAASPASSLRPGPRDDGPISKGPVNQGKPGKRRELGSLRERADGANADPSSSAAPDGPRESSGGLKAQQRTSVAASARSSLVPAIAGGGSHSLTLQSDATVGAWGQNGNGQFGDGTSTFRNTPVQALFAACPPSCDDGDACTTDTCDPVLGCVHTSVNCDDGNACTSAACDPVSGCSNSTIDCNDHDACTNDSCNPASGCVNASVSCDDGNVCTDDVCDPVLGCAHTPVNCDDGNACTSDSCDPAFGCLHAPVGCEDFNPCTDDSCDPRLGCIHPDNTIPCNDGNACTVGDVCNGGACVGTLVGCDDFNPCTIDSCTPSSGCANVPVNCDDTDPCTDDTCNPATGCMHSACSTSSQPSLCSLRDGTGNISLVFISNQTGVEAVYFNRYDPSGTRLLAADARVSTAGAPASSPSCGVDSGGNTHIVWKEGGALLYGKVGPTGSILVAPFTRVPAPIDDPRVDTETNGSVHIVWVSAARPRQVKYRQLDSIGGLIGGCPELTLDTSNGALSTEHPFVLAPGSGNTLAFMSWHGNNARTTDFLNLTAAFPTCAAFVPPAQQTNNLVVGRSALVPLFTVANSAQLVFEGTTAISPEHVYFLRGAGDYIPIDLGSGPAGKPGMAALNRQDILVVWEDDTAAIGRIASQTLNGITNAPVGGNCAVSPPGAAATNPAVARAGADRFAIAWESASRIQLAIRGLSCPPCIADADCDDANPCTDDACDPVIGCGHTNNIAPCDDSNACTTNDVCSIGTCAGGPPPVCDDANACTRDGCDPVFGCVFTPASCDDGNACTNDGCDPRVLPPLDPCIHPGNTLPCDDGNLCTENDACGGGSCVGGAPPNCDDGNPCTIDACDPRSGCTHAPIPSCPVCGTDADCNDSIPCTADACNLRTLLCEHTPDGALCDDGLFCDGLEVCDALRGCLPGTPPCSDDGVACTIEVCDEPANRCTHDPRDAACDDGLFCNGRETCDAGLDCQPGTPIDCNDNSACTSDACNEEGHACVHVRVPGPAEICRGGVDEDCDGLVDCLDPDCAGQPFCTACTFPGQRASVPGNQATETVFLSTHPAREATSRIALCGASIPGGSAGCARGAASGTLGTADVLVPDEDVVISDALLTTLLVELNDVSGNHLVEPGEDVELHVSLINAGPVGLQAVTATLSSPPLDLDGDGTTDVPVSFAQASSAYADCAAGPLPGAGGGNAPFVPTPCTNITPFRISFPPGHPSGVGHPFVLSVSGDLAGPGTPFHADVPFVLGVGGGCNPSDPDGNFDALIGLLEPMGPLVRSGEPVLVSPAFKDKGERPLRLRFFCRTVPLTDRNVPAPPEIVAVTRDGTPVDLDEVDPDGKGKKDRGAPLAFRFEGNRWQFKLSTKDLGPGQYVLTIRMPDSSDYDTGFILEGHEPDDHRDDHRDDHGDDHGDDRGR